MISANHICKTLAKITCTVGLTASLAAALQGCVIAAVAGIAGAAGGGALIATDRRTLGAQTEDREIQLKASSRLARQLPDAAHTSVTVFNRRVLLTGEVPDPMAKQQAEAIVRDISNVGQVINELAIQPQSTRASRTNDTYLEGRVKTALIAGKAISANHFKVVCERSNIYLMGLVTPDEGRRGAELASQVPGVLQVIKIFQYITEPQAAPAPTTAINTPTSSTQTPAHVSEPTVGAVQPTAVSAQPLSTQPPRQNTNPSVNRSSQSGESP